MLVLEISGDSVDLILPLVTIAIEKRGAVREGRKRKGETETRRG